MNFFKQITNGKLMKCIYLFASKLIERHIAMKTNEKKKKKRKINTVLKTQDLVVMEN